MPVKMDEKPTITTQPHEASQPAMHYDGAGSSTDEAATGSRLSIKERMRRQFLTKHGWFGDYDWGALCMPRLLPYSKKRRSDGKASRLAGSGATPFYGLHDDMPLLLTFICGLQHALAMLAGLITPPIIFASTFNLPASTQAYLISASLISAGILSALQMSAIPVKLPYLGRFQIGSGILTVVGTSFATLSVGSSIASTLYANGTCPSTTLADGTVQKLACPEGYGMLLGTAALCSLLEIFLSFLPARVLHRIFPPIITGPVVFLIGASLIGSSGFLNWGGGSGSCSARPATGMYSVCPQVGAPHALPWGSREYLGLGLFSFLIPVVLEVFGSPAMRSASIVIGLILPSLVLGIPLHYTSSSSIDSAPAITFLWTTTFPLKVYGPAVLPLLAVYCSLLSEAVGDITAASEVSRLEVKGPNFDRRVKGGVLSDGLAGTLSTLFTVTPMSIFAQNSGVIALTRVANRRAGFCCCAILVIIGVLSKISGVILAIPNPILGGITSFLFASVAVAGLSVLSKVPFTRRNRVILALSMTLGLGNLLVDDWATYFLPETSNQALAGFYQSIQIIIETPFLICAIVGSIANGIIPSDDEDVDERELLQRNAVRASNDHEVGLAEGSTSEASTSNVDADKQA